MNVIIKVILKEKMKEAIEASCGKQLTQLAKLVTGANGERWKHKLQEKHCCEDFKKKTAQGGTHHGPRGRVRCVSDG